jgi:hypoxanthine phosphoribosyltransferase
MPASVLLDADTIAETVARLGAEIENDHPDGVLLVAVLKGALLFVADLARAIRNIPVEVEFMSISRFAPDSGRVRILHDIGIDIGGRDVVVVEDIVDTGLTLAYLTSQLALREPRTLSTCALLDRPGRRIVPQEIKYRGLELVEQFVLGYGLHVRDLYRNLPFIAAGDRADVADAPDCYVPVLYRPDRYRRADDRPPRGPGAPEAGGSVTATPEARSEVL